MSESMKWEYRVEYLGSFFNEPKATDIEALLNDWGESGWELVSAAPVESQNKIRLIAKRPLTAENRRRRDWAQS